LNTWLLQPVAVVVNMLLVVVVLEVIGLLYLESLLVEADH
jgi:hypothetical protein